MSGGGRRLLEEMGLGGRPRDEYVKLLESKDVKGFAKFLESCKSVSVLIGAGISVSSGIPDFRSKGGFYETVDYSALGLTAEQRIRAEMEPEYILSIELFKENPIPYLSSRRAMILAPLKYRPTYSHWFLRLLHDKGKLKRVFSTNIDGLDQIAFSFDCDSDASKTEEQIVTVEDDESKVEMKRDSMTAESDEDDEELYELWIGEYALRMPAKKKDPLAHIPTLVNIHGTCGKAACMNCGKQCSMERFRKELSDPSFPDNCPILCEHCEIGWVKPSTVLYGQSLPKEFYDLTEHGDLDELDCFMSIGSSLVVQPSCQLPSYLDKAVSVRAFINRDPPPWPYTKELKDPDSNDLFLQGDCDDAFKAIAKELGWDEEVQGLMDEYNQSIPIQFHITSYVHCSLFFSSLLW